MRNFLAVLALAGALPLGGDITGPPVHVAQLSRDVINAVRKQREQQQSVRPAPERAKSGNKR
jgi:hypothetical protein